MQTPYLKVKKINKNAKSLSKRNEDAGYDLYGIFKENFVILNPGEIILVPTGISIEIPCNWVFFIAERGSTGSKGISRRCGIIDSGYRGEIFVPLNNTSNKSIIFAKYDNEILDIFLKENKIEPSKTTIYLQSKGIAQGILFFCPNIQVEEVDELNQSIRGNGMLGSSGK